MQISKKFKRICFIKILVNKTFHTQKNLFLTVAVIYNAIQCQQQTQALGGFRFIKCDN